MEFTTFITTTTINCAGTVTPTLTNTSTPTPTMVLDATETPTPTITETSTFSCPKTPTTTRTPRLESLEVTTFTTSATINCAGTVTATLTSPITPTATKTVTSMTLTLHSIAWQDGWILESSENSGIGGTINNLGGTLRLGDSPARQQYRSILSFNTGRLPDSAVITSVMLKFKKQGVIGGGSPMAIFQGMVIDIKNGFFGNAAALQRRDFQAIANKNYGPTSPLPVSGFYQINLTNGKAYINKLAFHGGLTQLRLRFRQDDNNNAIANYLSLYSGNATTAANRPQLVITYYVP